MANLLSSILLLTASMVCGAWMALGAAAHTPEQLPSDPAPINLAKDEAYRRDGSLIDINTCLAVADDKAVSRMLGHRTIRPIFDQPPLQLVDKLRNDDGIRTAERSLADDTGDTVTGYGTLLACAQIVAAWYSRTLNMNGDGTLSAAKALDEPNRGRFETGALIIDLGYNRNDRAVIAPEPLVRLLTSPSLVPPTAYGGIVVKNAIVGDALKLHNLRLTSPVAFINVRLMGDPDERSPSAEGDRPPATALAITSAQLDEYLVFAESEFCGDIVIDASRFEDTLAFHDVDQFVIGCWQRPDGQSKVGLWVEQSRFEQSLSLARSTFAAASIDGIAADELDIDRADFGRYLSIEENDLGSLSLDCSPLADDVRIVRNAIDKGLTLEGTNSMKRGREDNTPCSDWWQDRRGHRADASARLTIADNSIGAGLNLSHLDGPAITSPLRLPRNRVGGKSLIMMPGPAADGKPWAGQVTLQGSSYDGFLEIKLSPGQDKESWGRSTAGGYCKPVSGTTFEGIDIQLRAMRVETLHWNLPLTCNFRWLGYGLTYDLWLKGGFAERSLGEVVFNNVTELDHLAMEAWRRTLKRYDSPSINTMSSYFADNGEYVVSRQVLLEAKRLNYVPNCPPDQWVLGCAADVSGALLGSVYEAFSAPEASSGIATKAGIGGFGGHIADRFLNAADRLWSLAMLILLWPGGYGAQPERAFLLLLGVFVICWVIYARYTSRMREQLLNEWTSIDRFFAENVDRIARTTRLAEGSPGLADAQRTFDFEHLLPEHLLPMNGQMRWISEETWRRTLSHEERLREIQGPLLTRVRAWEETASEADIMAFQGFRERLERFGNTEIAGFGRFDGEKMPKRFTERTYSFDTMLPVIDLHAYANYYPIDGRIRMISIIQHVCGWWWITVFVASAAIL